MNFVKKIYRDKRSSYLIVVVFLFSFLFGFSANAQAWFQGQALDILATFIYTVVAIVGKLIGVVVSIMKDVANYNGFINSEPVTVGWEIIRDLCNMGFVIVLLIIAIASILRIESYSYRTWLPKLVIMAILINFSKMIAGVLIDASQIVMLTFVSGISTIGEGNILDILSVNQYLNFGSDFSDAFVKMQAAGDGNEINAMGIAGTIILALVVALIALVVVTAITIVLIIRIVALWILIILSPFAYLFSASPAGHKYASQWWQKFTQWVTTGPVMMFFIWLSLATMKSTLTNVFDGVTTEDPAAGLAAIGTPAVMGAFLLGSIMLMASLVVAQQLGGMASRVAGGAYNMITSRGDRMVRGTANLGLRTAGRAARAIPDAALSSLARSEGVRNSLDRISGSSNRFIRFSGIGATARAGLGSLRYSERAEEEQARRYASRFSENPHTMARLANGSAVGARANMVKRVAQEMMPDSEIFETERDRGPGTATVQMRQDALNNLNDLSRQQLNNLSPDAWYRMSSNGVFNQQDLDPNNNTVNSRVRGVLSTNSETARANRGSILEGLREHYGVVGPNNNITDLSVAERGSGNVAGNGQTLWTSADNAAIYDDNATAYTRLMADTDPGTKGKTSKDNKITGVNKLLRGAEGDNVRLAVDFDQIDLKGAGASMRGKDKKEMTKKLSGLLKSQGYDENELKTIMEKMDSSGSLQLINKNRKGRSGRSVIAHEAMHDQLENVNQGELRRVWNGIDEDKRKSINSEIRSTWHNGDSMSEADVMHEYFADSMANTKKTWAREDGHQLDDKTKNELQDIGLRPGSLKEITPESASVIQEKREEREYKEGKDKGFTIKDTKGQISRSGPATIIEKPRADSYEKQTGTQELDTSSLERVVEKIGESFEKTGKQISDSVGKVGKYGKNFDYAKQLKEEGAAKRLQDAQKKTDLDRAVKKPHEETNTTQEKQPQKEKEKEGNTINIETKTEIEKIVKEVIKDKSVEDKNSESNDNDLEK
ncbi:hypothetical protein HOC90_03445 [Candidatus Falkowbacteria bacterium]|nr:hypothetical protein [Candidatus Falkowbacteria bacterium]